MCCADLMRMMLPVFIVVPKGPNGDNPQYGPLARYVNLRVAHATGMTGTFPRPPRVSDPGMHHVPWCMPGSLTSGLLWSQWRGKRSRHFRLMRNLPFYVSGNRPTTSWPARHSVRSKCMSMPLYQIVSMKYTSGTNIVSISSSSVPSWVHYCNPSKLSILDGSEIDAYKSALDMFKSWRTLAVQSCPLEAMCYKTAYTMPIGGTNYDSKV